MTHICWGVIFMWFAWRGVHRAGKRWLNWAAALGLPVLLHAVTNASLVDVPGGTDINSEAVPTVMEFLFVLSGLGALVVSVWAAVICVVKGRRGEGNDQKPNAKYQGIPNVADTRTSGSVTIIPKIKPTLILAHPVAPRQTRQTTKVSTKGSPTTTESSNPEKCMSLFSLVKHPASNHPLSNHVLYTSQDS